MTGRIEVDAAYWGSKERRVPGRKAGGKALIAVAVELKNPGLGRIRLRHVPNADGASLHPFIQDSIKPGSTVYTDGLRIHRSLTGYLHKRPIQFGQAATEYVLPHAHRVISLLKR